MVSIICLSFSQFIIKSTIWNDLKRINWRQRQKTLCKLIRRVHRTATSPWSRFLLLLNFSSPLASLRSRFPSHFDCRVRIIPWNCLIFGRRNRFRGLLADFAFTVACDGKRRSLGVLAEEFLLMIANRMSWPSRRRRVWGAKRSENQDQFSADLLPPPPQHRFARNFFLRKTLVSSTLNQWSLGSREEWMNSKNFLSRFLFWGASSKIFGKQKRWKKKVNRKKPNTLSFTTKS